MKTKYCQSCGMPLTEAVCGTNADGSLSTEYCMYCYDEGKFQADCTMEEMIEICVPHMDGLSPQDARKLLEECLPHLKRWKNNRKSPG